MWALDEVRVEKEAALSHRSTKQASCFWLFVCLSFYVKKGRERATDNWSRALTYTQDHGHRI